MHRYVFLYCVCVFAWSRVKNPHVPHSFVQTRHNEAQTQTHNTRWNCIFSSDTYVRSLFLIARDAGGGSSLLCSRLWFVSPIVVRCDVVKIDGQYSCARNARRSGYLNSDTIYKWPGRVWSDIHIDNGIGVPWEGGVTFISTTQRV